MRRLSSVIFVLLLVAASAFAQTTSSEVNGTVKDEAGAAIAGATVRLIDNATKTEVNGTANDDGRFTFANIRPGTYTVVAEQPGFKRQEIQSVKVDVGVPATVNFTLPAGEVTETVTITSADAQAVINTTNAELSTTVGQRQINDLPLNGRNPLDLAALQPGVAAGAANRSATINGQRGTFSNITWDGININDPYIREDSLFGSAGQSVPGVAEFTLTSQNAGPSDGLGVAQVKLVTPRGSSEFHGSFFEYHRNDILDANTFFNNANGVEKPQLIRNQFGFNIGGPMLLPRFGEGGPRLFGRNKLFFYGYYEGTIERTGIELDRTVLTQAARTGQFTYTRADNGQLQTVNLLGLTGTNVNPLSQQLVGLTPLPNDLSVGDQLNYAGFNFNSPGGSDAHLWGFRIDYDHSERHRFEVIWSQLHFNLPNDPFNDIGEPFPGLPGGGQSSIRPRLSTAWNWTASPTLNNELRFGFFKNNPTFTTAEQSRPYQVTFPVGFTDPEQNFLPQGRNVATYELMDNAGKAWGSHFIQFGGNLRFVHVDPFNAFGALPQYLLGFNGVTTPNPLESVAFPGGISDTDFDTATSILAILTGSIESGTQTFNAASPTSGFVPGQIQSNKFRNWNLGAYVGDSWRVRENLTLNLGLRYEFISVPKDVSGLTLLPQGGPESLLNPNAVVDFASGGGRPFFNNDFNNFAPNVSFAWDPFRDGKTSIRGGYGISYVIDNNLTTIQNAAAFGNDGLSTTITDNEVVGSISNPSAIAAPTFQVPRTARLSFEENPVSALFTIDPNLRTPYVQQWNIGIEREILKNTAFEVRYVGNRGTKLTRAIDLNQQRIRSGGFLEDFNRARFNMANCGGNPNPSAAQCPGRQALQLLPQFGPFAFFSTQPITSGQPSALLDFYIQFKEFFFPEYGGLGTVPITAFLPNPSTYAADLVGNGSYSTYNALQAEVRRRYSGGLDFQANYTWSKNLTDYEGGQANFEAYQDMTLGSILEKRRGRNDLTHVFKANAGYELPFGPGKRWLSDGFASKALGGIKLTGIFVAQSGRPISITSQLQTLNRGSRANRNTVNSTLSNSELQDRTGLFFDPTTGRPLLFDPELIAAVRANPYNNAFLTNPQPGFAGSLGLTPVSGPGYWNVDFGLIKRTPITEDVNIEFRAEAFNVFNHTNFFIPVDATTEMVRQNINSATFGQITQTFDPRILQFAVKLNF
ncbi:MAG TPA: TonB-dependent receptor [Pyrinomonadaceae bacterium]|nr:TonB-dependent receptor [Pyrinomonadaceae bacterium]